MYATGSRVRGRAARTQPLGGSGTEPPSLRPVGSVGHRKAIGSSRHIGLRSVGTWCMVSLFLLARDTSTDRPNQVRRLQVRARSGCLPACVHEL